MGEGEKEKEEEKEGYASVDVVVGHGLENSSSPQ